MIKYHHLNIEHIDRFVEFINENSQDLIFFHPHNFDKDSLINIIESNKNDVYLLMFYNDKIIGYGLLRGWDEGYVIPSLGILIDKDWRGKGYSKELITVLHSIAKEKKSNLVRLTVKKSNTIAITLYEKLGYIFKEHSDDDLVGFLNLCSVKCPICGTIEEHNSINSYCIFTNKAILRYICSNCGLIFGPMDYINMSQKSLINEYKNLYSSYSESDTTEYEIKTFSCLSPNKDGHYLNYGSGVWSKSTTTLREMGYNIDCYDISFDSINTIIENKKYDGIFSHNLIEHLQNPVEVFNKFNRMLKDNGIMAHSTSCYEYKYEFSIFHLFFYLGDSINILSEKSGFNVENVMSDGDYVLKLFKKL